MPLPAAMSDWRGSKAAFLGWQCRTRQEAVRLRHGRPDASMMPELRYRGDDAGAGRIVTVLCRRPEFSVLPEFRHMAKSTMDPVKIREAALKFLSAGYYQEPARFSDVVTASFAGASLAAARLAAAGACTLTFEALSHRFTLECRVLELGPSDHLREATWLHNSFFNPELRPDVRILGFQPDWQASEAMLPGSEDRAKGLRVACAGTRE